MELAEILRREAPRLQQRHRQGVAHDELHGGRGGRREAVGAGLLGFGQIKTHIGLASQSRFGVGGEGHQCDAVATRIGDDVGQLRRLARP